MGREGKNSKTFLSSDIDDINYSVMEKENEKRNVKN
jgi:hypothetical protein